MIKKIILIIVIVATVLLINKGFYNSQDNILKTEATENAPVVNTPVVLADEITPNEDIVLQNKIDQLFIVGFRGMSYTDSPDIKKIIKETNVGGVILFDYDSTYKTYNRNIKSFSQIKNLISDIQSNAKTKLFIAIDEEGGLVSRLKTVKGYTKTPKASLLGTMTDEKVFEIGQGLGKTLSSLGFNIDFAPVLDTNVNTKSPIIGAVGRSFSSDPEIVASKGIAFSNGLMNSGIVSVGKHYPGHGSAISDTHLGFTDITNTYKSYESIPFEKACNSKIKAIMVAHLYDKNVDPVYPATLSSKHIDNLKKIGCSNALLVSDDMDMKAITKQYSRKDALIRAINSGIDVLIISNNISKYDSSEFFTARKIIFDAVKDGSIKESRIDEAYNKIISLKTLNKII